MSRWDDLLAVQEHDTTIDQLVHRRAHLPSRAELDGGHGRARGPRGRAGAGRGGSATNSGRDQQRLEDEIASLNDRANQHDKTLYSGTIGNPRELQSLQDEIASLKRRISQLEDQELEVMEQIEPLDAELATFAAPRASSTSAARRSARRSRRRRWRSTPSSNRSHASGRRWAAPSTPSCSAEYDELRKRSGGIAIARHGRAARAAAATSASRRSTSIASRSSPPEAPAYCEECGRLLAR